MGVPNRPRSSPGSTLDPSSARATPATNDTAAFIRNKQSQRPRAFRRRVRAGWPIHSCTAQHRRIHKAKNRAKRCRGSHAVAWDVHSSARQRTARLSSVARALQRQKARGPPNRRPVRSKHKSAAPLPCSFRLFSNGGRVNSACEQGMAQTMLSMTVMAIWARFMGGIRMRRHL